MYTIFTAALLWAICALILAHNYRQEIRRNDGRFVADEPYLAGGAAALIVLAFASAPFIKLVIEPMVPLITVKEEPRTLVAMKTSDATSGAFVWGSGGINTDTQFLVYVRNTDGSMTPHHIRADALVRIYEDENLQNSGTWITYRKVRDKSVAAYKWYVGPDRTTIDHIELHVPKGTVKHDFGAN